VVVSSFLPTSCAGVGVSAAFGSTGSIVAIACTSATDPRIALYAYDEGIQAASAIQTLHPKMGIGDKNAHPERRGVSNNPRGKEPLIMNENFSFSNEHPLEHLCPPCPGTCNASAIRCSDAQRCQASPSGANTPKPPSSGPSLVSSLGTGDIARPQGSCYRHPGNPGRPYRNCPIRPVAIELDQALLLMKDPEWGLQEKFDGQHIVIRKSPDGVEGINEAGAVTSVPALVARAAEKINRRWSIEGVCIGDASFVAFDLLQVDFLDFRSTPYWLRMSGLRKLLSPEAPHLRIAETATKFLAKAGLLERLRDDRKAGFVFKKSTGIRVFDPSPERAFSLVHAFDRSTRSPGNPEA